ncbi:hypothetical protein LIER_35357 [Lithospermum erythrorhizon]|uniref:Uncharacterized protein n=1 Tax=Lithospermum erythrorhizon TaxID=34254 RepID=A0AAV3NQU3_LITER
MEETRKIPRCSSSPSSSLFLLSSSLPHSETKDMQMLEHAPPFWRSVGKKTLSKQLSFNNERPRDIAWKKRRRQKIHQEKKKNKSVDLTDEDLNELKGCIELGFGFKEEEGQRLCNTLPALDLYFAVNRHYFSTTSSPVSTPGSFDSPLAARQLGDRSASAGTLGGESANNNNSWKICSPGDDPQQVKIKLRHWAQAVACSVLQSY